MEYYLGIDIGASSGRHILAHLEQGKLKIEEIYRFENGIKKIDGEYCWDIAGLFNEVKNGIKKCKSIGRVPKTVGIDTWGVDFVLLDEKDILLGNAVSYRDDRTEGFMDKAFEKIPKDMLYLYTGIQFQRFNTLYQLLSIKENHKDYLENAKTFLMIPDYLNFLLTGRKTAEYTNASTTQLLSSFDKTWDYNILDTFGINKSIFPEINLPKTKLGGFREELVREFGFDAEVVLVASHDTGSAFIASACNEDDSIFLSSGTWSLIGVENSFPICVPQAMEYNFTNEGGIDYRYRFLKNIMGLWIIQEVRRNLNNRYSFEEIADMARKYMNFKSVIDVDDDRFLKPQNMIQEIKEYCRETGQDIPKEVGEIAFCVFNSLAHSYQTSVGFLEEIFEKKFKKINIFGGGCKNDLLNELVAEITGKTVFAGPSEATAIGNISAQLLSLGIYKNLGEIRELIKNSFDIKKFN